MLMELDTLGARLIWARTMKGWDQATLIEMSGVPQGTVSKIERGDQSTTGKYAAALARPLGVEQDWLTTGEGQPYSGGQPMSGILEAHSVKYASASDQQEVMIRQFKDVRWAAGSGSMNSEHSDMDEISFKRSYMDKNSLDPNQCIACAAAGDSMSPTINDGDMMLINLAEKNPNEKDGKIYAFAVSNACKVKRVFSTISGGFRLVSDNPNKLEYPDEFVSPEEVSDLNIAGRVRWTGGDK